MSSWNDISDHAKLERSRMTEEFWEEVRRYSFTMTSGQSAHSHAHGRSPSGAIRGFENANLILASSWQICRLLRL
jgi:hypothetical protein